MYTNISKSQAFPMAIRVTCQHNMGLSLLKTSKFQSFSNGVYPKPSLNPKINGLLNKPRKMAFSFGGLCVEFALPKSQAKGVRCFSSVVNGGHGYGDVKGRNDLPWLADAPDGPDVSQFEVSRKRFKAEKAKAGGSSKRSGASKSSWEISAEKVLKGSGKSVGEDEGRRGRAVGVVEERQRTRVGRDGGNVDIGLHERRQVREASVVEDWRRRQARRYGRKAEDGMGEGRHGRAVDVVEDWRNPAFRRDGRMAEDGEGEERHGRGVDVVEDWRKPGFRQDVRKEEDGEDKDEVINDPRWNNIKTRAGRVLDDRVGSNKTPVMRRRDREEKWGRKIYREIKEASESTVPKMVGEGLYGVGPVLAALCAERREFYALYVQEGLEFTKNNKKRKDKKGFEKVLKIAEKIGISIKEVSKHDLNMVSDNRPHQGLVLDSSPLEMLNIKELETASSEHDKGVLWVALDEVTDPQNLGAIIRSSYFFGATGVVLCAKNSAPLSGVVSKASAGSLELMEIRSCKNMMQFLTSSAENGWRVVGGSVASRAVPLREVGPGEPTILVLGSEGTGLRPLVERSCTQLVKIPGNVPVDVTSGRFEDGDDEDEDSPVEEHKSSGEEFQSFMAVESLNVSVAAGVLLHHFIGGNYASLDQPRNVDNNALD